MSTTFNHRVRRLWEDAQIHPEWATTRLWKYLFHRRIFNDDEWIVSSQQPPTHEPGDLRRVDLVVQQMDAQANTVGTLLFLEAKRADATDSDILNVEYQVFTAACAYHFESGMQNIWTMTCIGSVARFWIFTGGSEFLIPFVPENPSMATRGPYLEISTHEKDIIQALDYIKAHPVPPANFLSNPSSPRPTNATLPGGWHDDEVATMDEYYHQGAAASTTSGVSASSATPGNLIATYPAGSSAQLSSSQLNYAASSGGSHGGPSSHQNDILDAHQCVLVDVVRIKMVQGLACYECSLGVDKGYLNLPVDGWEACKASYQGTVYSRVYRKVGSSSTVYPAWTLPS